jgi:hypothetical protein
VAGNSDSGSCGFGGTRSRSNGAHQREHRLPCVGMGPADGELGGGEHVPVLVPVQPEPDARRDVDAGDVAIGCRDALVATEEQLGQAFFSSSPRAQVLVVLLVLSIAAVTSVATRWSGKSPVGRPVLTEGPSLFSKRLGITTRVSPTNRPTSTWHGSGSSTRTKLCSKLQ